MVSVAALPQTSSPAIGSPQSFTSGTDSVSISMNASDLENAVATAGEEVDYRRVLGEGSVIEVELIRVDPDDLEGPLGVEGRSGVSGGNTPVSSGWSTPQSARSSFVRSYCLPSDCPKNKTPVLSTSTRLPPWWCVLAGSCIDRNSVVPWETWADREVPSIAPVQVSCGRVDRIRGTRLVRIPEHTARHALVRAIFRRESNTATLVRPHLHSA